MRILEYIQSEVGHANRDMFKESIDEIEILYKKFVNSIKSNNEISESFSQFDFDNLMQSIKDYNITIHNIPYNSITNFIFSIDVPLNEKNEVSPNNFTTFFKGAFENFLEIRYRKSEVINNIEDELEDKLKALLNRHKEGLVTKKPLERDFDIDKVKQELKIIEVVYKLIDHISLAIEQKTGLYDKQKVEIKAMRNQIEQLSNNLNDENEKVKTIQKAYLNIEKSRGKIYTEFVAILGIFSSIIFGVFGGFQEIQLIGKNLNTTPIPKLLIFSSLVMLGVTLIIFLCFNAISKITNMPMRSCNCKAGECNCSFRKRHPTIFYSSCIYLYVLLVGFALRLYKYNDFKFSDLYNGIPKGYDILPLLLLILPLIPLLIALIIHVVPKRKES